MKRLFFIAFLGATTLCVLSFKGNFFSQCQAQSSQFQCPAQAEPGSDYCKYHSSWKGQDPFGVPLTGKK